MMAPSAIETIIGTFVVVSAALLWWTQPRFTSDEPKAIAHTIPILGLAYSWVQDRKQFFQWADTQAKNQPFSMLIAGKKHHVFSRPSDVSTIFRKPKAFSIRPFIDMIHARFFNMSPSSIQKMHNINPQLHKLYEKYLLAPEGYEPVVVNYIKDLRSRFVGLNTRAAEEGELEYDAFNLILDTQAMSSVVAYFGHLPVELHPQIMRDMSTFVAKGFWPLIAGVPSFLLGEVRNARRKVADALLRGFHDPVYEKGGEGVKPEDASAFATEHTKLLKSVLEREEVGRMEFSFVFGFMSNSSPTTYCTLLRILSQPDLQTRLLQEIKTSGFLTAPLSEIPSILPTRLPLLKSVYYESIRLHVVSSSIREVMETTTVSLKPTSADEGKQFGGGQEGATYTLHKGSVVNMPSSMLHFNASVNPEPEKFVPERFMSKEQGGWGQSYTACTRGFGGGVSYCPGRVFAERQILGFLALLIGNFEIELKGEAGMPKSAEFDDVAKTLPRAILRLRRRAHSEVIA